VTVQRRFGYEYGVPMKWSSETGPRRPLGHAQGFMFKPRFHHRIPYSYTYSYTQISFIHTRHIWFLAIRHSWSSPTNSADHGRPNSGSCSDGRPRPWEFGPPDDDNPGLDEADQEQLVRVAAKNVLDKGCGNGAGGHRRWAEDICKPVSTGTGRTGPVGKSASCDTERRTSWKPFGVSPPRHLPGVPGGSGADRPGSDRRRCGIAA
jgi:hypothetical protein